MGRPAGPVPVGTPRRASIHRAFTHRRTLTLSLDLDWKLDWALFKFTVEVGDESRSRTGLSRSRVLNRNDRYGIRPGKRQVHPEGKRAPAWQSLVWHPTKRAHGAGPPGDRLCQSAPIADAPGLAGRARARIRWAAISLLVQLPQWDRYDHRTSSEDCWHFSPPGQGGPGYSPIRPGRDSPGREPH